LAFAWSLFLSLAGVVLLVALPPLLQSAESGYCENDDHPGPCSDLAEWMVPGLVVLTVGTWCLVASVGLLKRRPWARWAVVATFSLWGLGALVALVAEATSADGVHIGASLTWLILLGYFAATGLLAATGRTEGAADR
jgi:hypothetical protein